MIRDGQRVQYVGASTPDVAYGDQGKVLVVQGSNAHVKWASGALTLVVSDDVAPLTHALSIEAALDDSLDVEGGFEVVAARETYEEDGPEGVLNKMAASGHLASFAVIAQDVLDDVEARLRQDPAFMAVVGSLDDPEADSVVRLAALALIRDAYGSAD